MNIVKIHIMLPIFSKMHLEIEKPLSLAMKMNERTQCALIKKIGNLQDKYRFCIYS